jgi:hypothetical protein
MLRTALVATTFSAAFVFANPAAADDADALFDALGLPDIIDVMRQEGIAYGAQIGSDLFPNRVTPAWAATVATIYDGEVMHDTVRAEFNAVIEGADVASMLAFFQSEPGQSIIELEVSARRALLDDAVDVASKEAAKIAQTDNTVRFQLIEDFAAGNDLLETNVADAMSANMAFYMGLTDGGAFDDALTEDQILADVWDQEPDIRANTSDWVYSFLLLAYDPLSDEDIAAYTAFSNTDAGAALNAALFSSFDDMFDGISFALGREAARTMASQDL